MTAKFITAQMLVAGWLGVSLWLSLPWVRELAAATLTVPAIVVVSLVAQGAFSLYRTQALRAAGGWSDAIGEDIVLPWKLMRQGPGSTTSPPRSPLPPPRPGWFTWRASGPAGLGA